MLTATRSGMEVADLRKLGDFLRDREPNVVAVLAAVNGAKVSFLAVCGKGGKMNISPAAEAPLSEGDRLIIIAPNGVMEKIDHMLG